MRVEFPTVESVELPLFEVEGRVFLVLLVQIRGPVPGDILYIHHAEGGRVLGHAINGESELIRTTYGFSVMIMGGKEGAAFFFRDFKIIPEEF